MVRVGVAAAVICCWTPAGVCELPSAPPQADANEVRQGEQEVGGTGGIGAELVRIRQVGTDIRAARIGPTVCDLYGPMPIESRSKRCPPCRVPLTHLC